MCVLHHVARPEGAVVQAREDQEVLTPIPAAEGEHAVRVMRLQDVPRRT